MNFDSSALQPVKLAVRWSELPASVRRHLIERVTDRSITKDDLYKLQFWRELGPDVPERRMVQGFRDLQTGGARSAGADVPFA